MALTLKTAFAKADSLRLWVTGRSEKGPLFILMGIDSGKFTASKVKKLENVALEKSTSFLPVCTDSATQSCQRLDSRRSAHCTYIS